MKITPELLVAAVKWNNGHIVPLDTAQRILKNIEYLENCQSQFDLLDEEQKELDDNYAKVRDSIQERRRVLQKDCPHLTTTKHVLPNVGIPQIWYECDICKADVTGKPQ